MVKARRHCSYILRCCILYNIYDTILNKKKNKTPSDKSCRATTAADPKHSKIHNKNISKVASTRSRFVFRITRAVHPVHYIYIYTRWMKTTGYQGEFSTRYFSFLSLFLPVSLSVQTLTTSARRDLNDCRGQRVRGLVRIYSIYIYIIYTYVCVCVCI